MDDASPARNHAFDLYRALAVCSVVLGHFALMHVDIDVPVRFFLLLPINYGVPIFFIISGYLLAGSANTLNKRLPNPREAIRSFYLLRIIRIYPAYVIWMMILWAIHPTNYYDILTHCLNIHNFFPDYWRSINPVFWSLAVEFQWYCVAPLIFFLLLHRLKSIAFSTFFFLLLLSVASRNFVILKFFNHTIPIKEVWRLGNEQVYIELYSFALGVLVWRFRKHSWQFPKTIIAFLWLTLFAIGGQVYHFYFMSIPVSFTSAEFVVLMNLKYASQIILALLIYTYRNVIFHSYVYLPVHFIAIISYSMYIIHYPVLHVIYSFDWQLWTQALAYVSATVLLSTCSYFLVERPFQSLAKILKTRAISGS